jgi:two-component system, response regulator, stage 0 sporulation protein F
MSKILVVDDELGLREALYYAFSKRGHTVTTAINNEHAMELMSMQPFDLIILDVVMPGEYGTVLLKTIRNSGNKVPVVIYSVKVDANLEKDAKRLGANEVLHKSVSLDVLMDRTEKVLRSAGKAPQPAAGAKKKLLVVDDEVPVRQILMLFFQKKGYEVFEAASGEEALERLASIDPDIVLLDMHMGGGMSGIETLRKIREEYPKLGVVMATGDEDDRAVREAMEIGAYGYVLKPFDFLYLELVVASRLSIAQTPDAL